MMRHGLTQRAEHDLKDVFRYTTETFGAKQAEKYLFELDAVFQLIAQFPNMGRRYHGETLSSSTEAI